MTLYTSALKPFAFNSTDIRFLLDQVKFRPLYDLAGTLILNWDGTSNVYTKNHTLIYTATSNDPTSAAAIAAVDLYGTSYQTATDLAGLRDPSGLDNNLLHPTWGAVDQIFVRSAAADYAHYSPIYSGTAGVYDPNASAAVATYYKTYSNGLADGKFNLNGTLNTDYTITVGGAQTTVDGTAVTINNVVDYTPRMISVATTTAGVTYDTWASHPLDPNFGNHSPTEIYYNPATGLPTVTDWGQLETTLNGGLGQVDTQARFAGSAGEGDHFIGGLNPGVSPSNGFFVLFGQFFDHGLDFIDKGGQGKTIKITLATTDVLYGMTGADGQPVHEITINRATVNSVDANGAEYVNHTSPFIDQSQTYGSHEQLTTLLRKWVVDPVTGVFHAGMSLFDGQTLATQWKDANGNLTNATLPTLNELRAHVEATGRDGLTWEDVSNYRNRDAAGHVSTGASGSALILDMNPRFDEVNLHQGNGAQDTLVDAALTTLNTWLSTSAHPLATLTLAPGGVLTLTGWVPGPALTGASALMPFVNFGDFSIKSTITGLDHAAVGNILLASVGDHYIAGDGRVNENFGLTSIHHVFHEEHNYQVGNLMDALHREAVSTNSFANLHEFQVDTGHGENANHDYINASGEVTWNLDKMFNASKLVVEMEYQHAAVDQYARNVTPNIQEFVGYSPDKNAAVSLEYAQAAFRFGHSTLRETIDTIDPTHGLTGKIMGYALRDAFLNPDAYASIGPSAIILGMSHQQMNEVDELVTPALNQGLLGQPLDLAAINIARGRDLGIPTLNDFRAAVGLARYTSWTDFGQNMQHPGSVGNFIAAYSFDGNLAKGNAIAGLVAGTITEGTAAAEGFTLEQATIFMSGGDLGFDHIDTWLGGLAEVHQPGGLLGETFDLVFVNQIESLMDGDRFYYLYRLAGQQFAEEVGGGQLKDIVERNTGLTHLNGNIFGYSDKYYDFGATPDAVNTTSNEHKYGANPLLTGTVGVYSNGGATNSHDGQLITIGGKQYVQDTRVASTDPLSLDGQNDFVNLDGTPNSGAESNEVIVGTKGNDLIYAQGGDDTVYGEDGNDKIYGGYGIDRLYGGNGVDYLYGGDNPDLIDGGAGDDFLYGESSGSDINGADQLIGGSGNDYVDGGIGIDKLSGGTGDDHVVGGQDTDPFTHGSDGNDWVEGNSGGDILYGDNGDDLLVGGADQDQMFGGNGDDIIRPGDSTGALTIGTDEVLGGDGVTDEGNVPGTIGFDIIDFSDNAVRPGGVPFDLSSQVNPVVTVNGTPTQVQSFQMEGVIGSAGGDTLTGADDNNWLIGGSGNDTFSGGLGDDIIIGGSIRLDALIGKYESATGVLSTYDHNNANNGLTEADQLQDARYQGASQRVGYLDTLATTSGNRGIIDTVNNLHATTADNYEKHFTEMLRSRQFRDTVLGDNGAGGTDTVVLSGNRNEYALEFVTVAGHTAVRLTDQVAGRDGSDLIIDVANFKFANGTVGFAGLTSTRTVSISGPVTVTEGDGGPTNAVFTVTLNGAAPAGGASIDFATVAGTALAGSDYVAQTGTVNIAAGQTTGTITIAVIGDTIHELTEAFTVALSNPVNAVFGGGASVGTATIIDNDAAPAMSVAGLSVNEGDVGTTNATLTIQLSGPSATPTVVNYTTANGSATAGTDYAATSGSVTFAAGETSKTVTVAVNGDVVHELNETFTFNLTSTDTFNASAGATVTIVDNDAVPMVSIGNTTVTEGAGAVAHFTVSLSAASSQNVTVAYSTTQGTALNGSDFTATTGTATILAGQTTADIAVAITNDGIHETSPEFFTVNLSGPTNATLGNAQGVGFINDDDAPTLAALTLAPAVLEDGSRIITLAELTAGISNNASGTLAITSLTAPAGHGVVVNNGNGTWTYTPAVNDDTSVTFTYTATDGAGSWNGSATLDITPVNDAPVVANASATGNEDIAITGTLTSTDIDGPARTYSVVTGPAHGTLTLNAASGAYSYLGAANYNGPDSFTFKANDGSLDSNVATVSLTLAAVNDAPVVAGAVGLASVNDNQVITGNLLTGASDVDGDVLSVVVTGLTASLASVSGPASALAYATTTAGYVSVAAYEAALTTAVKGVTLANGNINLNANAGSTTQALFNGLEPGQSATINLSYTVSDGHGGLSAQTGSVVVTGALEAVLGTGAVETLNGGKWGDNLQGLAGNDTLRGNDGNDRLEGGAGQDSLYGGAGNDTFVFSSVADSAYNPLPPPVIRDRIYDFVKGSDIIDLSGIDANTANGAGTNDAFAFIGSAAFTGVAGQLRIVSTNAGSDVYGDVNGDGVADLHFYTNLTTATPLAATDFIL